MTSKYHFPIFQIKNDLCGEGERRLNASSHSPSSTQSIDLIKKLKSHGVTIVNVENIVDKIFFPNRFKRPYSNEGTSFLSSKEIFDIYPLGKKIKNPSSDYIIEPSWILITRSGTVGKVLIANSYFKDVAISEHVIRIVPNNNTPCGYLYAFLNSKIGQSLLLKNVFGGVVDEIETNHIGKLPLPIIKELIEEINKNILKSKKLREDAQTQLTEVNIFLRKKLQLPDPNSLQEKGNILKIFNVRKKNLDSRFDGAYHYPVHLKIINAIKKSKYPIVKLSDLTTNIFEVPPFKHIYVNQENGIPFYTSAEIFYSKLMPTRYLSKVAVDIETYRIKKGWILMARSGDPEEGVMGKIRMVCDGLDNATTSDHIIRIIPDKEKVHPGYLSAFLMDRIYAKRQLLRGSFGKNVPAVRPAHIRNILIPLPEQRTQKEIGEKILLIYKKFDQANKLEIDTIANLERKLHEY
jgi:type I restriction enzyme, S subunit